MTATTSTQAKIDFVLQMPNGATHAVNYKTQEFDEETQKITNGKGVDVIIDFVGRTHWHKNVASLAKDGRMTLLALLSGVCFSVCLLHPSNGGDLMSELVVFYFYFILLYFCIGVR